jgi:hypothetical protein
MNRRNFLSIASGILSVPLLGMKSPEAKSPTPKIPQQEYNDLWTYKEIEDAGFVPVYAPSFIHQYNDPYHPIMKSYIGYGNKLDPNDPNLHPIIAKSSMCSPRFIKDYDFDAGRMRGIESIGDYHRKKDIFKPMILQYMREREYHYVYRVLLGESPGIWTDKWGYEYCFPVFVRGARLPKTI